MPVLLLQCVWTLSELWMNIWGQPSVCKLWLRLESLSTQAAALAGNQQSCGCYSFLKTLLVNIATLTLVILGLQPTDYDFFFLFYSQYCLYNIIKCSNKSFIDARPSFRMWQRIRLQVIITSASVNTRSRLSSQLWKITTLPRGGSELRMCGRVHLQCSWQPTVWKEWLRVIAMQLLAFVCVCVCVCACMCVCVCSSLVCD